MELLLASIKAKMTIIDEYNKPWYKNFCISQQKSIFIPYARQFILTYSRIMSVRSSKISFFTFRHPIIIKRTIRGKIWKFSWIAITDIRVDIFSHFEPFCFRYNALPATIEHQNFPISVNFSLIVLNRMLARRFQVEASFVMYICCWTRLYLWGWNFIQEFFWRTDTTAL